MAGEYLELSDEVCVLIQILVSTSTSRQLLRRLIQCASDIQYRIWNHPNEDITIDFFRPLYGRLLNEI